MASSSKPKLTPDTLTERWLRGLGWDADQCHRREGLVQKDLFGIADQYAFGAGLHLWVQSTTSSNVSARRRKILASEVAERWKRDYAGNRIYLVGWYDRTGERAPRVEEIQWDAVTARLVAVPIEDPQAALDVGDPQFVARARGKS